MQAPSRRIENYLGFPAGISGNELLTRAASQARKFGARVASPYRAQELQPGNEWCTPSFVESVVWNRLAVVIGRGCGAWVM